VTAASSTLESPDQTTILKANRPHTAHFNLIAQPSPPAPLSVVRQEMCSVARVCVCVRACGGCYPRRAIIQGSLSAQASKSVRDYVQMMDSSLWLVDLAGIFTRCHYRDDAHERL